MATSALNFPHVLREDALKVRAELTSVAQVDRSVPKLYT